MPGHLLYTWRGSATSSPGEVGLLGRECWHGPRRCGRRTTLIVHKGHYLACVLLSDRWPPSSLRCRRRRSSPTNCRAARPSARTRRRRTRPWPGCPAPCSTKGVEVDWRLARLLTPANLDLLRGPIPFSSVWKSNFGRPTPSTRGWPDSLVDFHAGSRAVREIRPGHVPGVSLHEYHIFSKKTNTAVAAIAGPERGPGFTEATVR